MKISVRAPLAAVFVLAIGICGGSALAQQQPSAAALATAHQLLDLKHATSVYQGAVPGMIDRVRLQLMQNNVSYQKDLNDIATQLNQQLKGRDSEIGDEMARLYATDFTEQELKELLAFYKTPLGQKVLTQEPKTIEASLQFMRNWGEKFGDEIDARFHEEMKKRGKPIQ